MAARAADAVIVDGVWIPLQATSDYGPPFSLVPTATEVNEAIAQFESAAKQSEWKRTLECYASIPGADLSGLLHQGQGFFKPAQRKLWELVRSLPPSGLTILAAHFDPEAARLLEGAQGDAELANLEQLTSCYLFTSVGDLAANRLGDVYYARGQIDKAIASWQTILTYRLDSPIPRAELLLKIVRALHSLQRWNQFEAIRHELIEKHGSFRVSLDNLELTVSEHVARLIGSRDTSATFEAASAGNPAPASDIDLSSELPASWRFTFNLTRDADSNRVGSVSMADVVPYAIADNTRLFVNYLGYCAALDLKTGQLLWSNENPPDLATRIEVNQYTSPLRYTSAVTGDELFIVARTVRGFAFSEQRRPLSLVCMDSLSGRPIWRSRGSHHLLGFDFIGVPIVHCGRLYVSAEAAGVLHLLAIHPATGQLLFSTRLGSDHVPDPRMALVRDAQPSLVAGGDHVYLDTNNGAVIAVDAYTGVVKWAFAYPAPSRNPQLEAIHVEAIHEESVVSNRPLYAGGILYAKGMRSPRLFAIETGTPKLLWQRPVSKQSMLHSVRNNRVLMSDMDLKSMDLATGEVKWSAPLPNRGPFARPLETRSQILFFTSRGIVAYDRDSGQQLATLPGEDRSSRGGTILRTDDQLITVSNRAITVYSIIGQTRPAVK